LVKGLYYGDSDPGRVKKGIFSLGANTIKRLNPLEATIEQKSPRSRESCFPVEGKRFPLPLGLQDWSRRRGANVAQTNHKINIAR